MSHRHVIVRIPGAFDTICLTAYCGYIGVYFYIPVHYIISENFPIATRLFILVEQVNVFVETAC